MSRMDRYKDIHRQAKPIDEEKKFNPRKENRSAINEQIPREEAHIQEENPSSSIKQTIRQPKPKKIKKPKRKRRFSWPKRIGLLFLLLIVLMVGFFFKGKSYAENDTSLPKEELETFNGVEGANGTNILILGSDTRGEDAGRADTIMVLQLGTKPKLISFMRDTLVDIPEVGENKINAAYAYGGAELVRETLVNNFNLNCKYYAKVDFQSFEKIVDAMFPNGVKIDAEKDINLDGVDIAQGEQKMDGHTLLQYARFRMDEEGDFGRVRRQQQVMGAVISQLKNPMSVVRAPESLGRLVGYMTTDIPSSYMVLNSPGMLLSGGKIDSLSVPVEDSWSYGDSYYVGSYLQIDFDVNQAAIQNFLNQ